MYDPYLAHYGIKGMKWGVRRYQNKDGSLTAEGKKHVSNYKRNQQLRKKKYEETDKLIKSDKRLQRDFGSANQVDDNKSKPRKRSTSVRIFLRRPELRDEVIQHGSFEYGDSYLLRPIP